MLLEESTSQCSNFAASPPKTTADAQVRFVISSAAHDTGRKREPGAHSLSIQQLLHFFLTFRKPQTRLSGYRERNLAGSSILSDLDVTLPLIRLRASFCAFPTAGESSGPASQFRAAIRNWGVPSRRAGFITG